MTIANDWLARFERALAEGDDTLLEALFHPDSYWRDVLALTWHIRTVSGRDAILGELKAHASRARPSGFRTDPQRTAPRRVMRAGTSALEAIFRFETAEGRGNGVLRLIPDASDGNTLKAWTLLTALDEIRGLEERVGKSRPTGESYSRDFRGPNWLDLRKSAAEYVERDPVVLVVGGGQAGLSIAARLAQLQVDTLIVDRERRIGDNWRNRYHALTLHNQVHVNHLPYMPFPPNWPLYIPKDKVASWFESYVESMELNYWTATEFRGGTYDEAEERWSVPLQRPGAAQRVLRPRHIVMATGVSGIPNLPDLPTLRNFGGKLLHSSQYGDGEAWQGKSALVIGTGNSGHDIAQDLYSSGAKVTLVQRSPTLIVNIEPSAQLPYALYDEGPPLEDCDLITMSIPFSLARKSHILFTEKAKDLDKELLDSLERVGFKLDFGEDGTGWQFKYLTRGGGYYFNVGCSDLIVQGEIGLVQFSDIAGFVAAHVHAQRAAGPVVHRREFCPVPDLLEVSRPPDQGLRSRPAAPASRPGRGNRLTVNYLIILRPTRVGMVKEGPTEREAAIVGQHFEYLQAQARAGKVRIAGRTTENDERTIGLVLVDAASEEEARALMLADPAVAKGVMRAELHPFRLAVTSSSD